LPFGGATNFEMLSVGSEVIVATAGSTAEQRHISDTVPFPYNTYQHTYIFIFGALEALQQYAI